MSLVQSLLANLTLLQTGGTSPGNGQTRPVTALDAIFGNMGVMFALIIMIFYFLVWRPQKKQQKDTQAMQAGLKKNDNVRTNAGFFGKVVSVDKDQDLVVLKIDDSHNVRMRVLRSSIVAVVPAKNSK